MRLSSDSIAHSYTRLKALRDRGISTFSDLEGQAVRDSFSTIGGYILFPSNRIDGKRTINAARGMTRSIGDRFDLTLECIRCLYLGVRTPLSETLQRYDFFFSLFGSFRGYCEFFKLEALVSDDFNAVRFLLPFLGDFSQNPLPSSKVAYTQYLDKTKAFVKSRGKAIAEAT